MALFIALEHLFLFLKDENRDTLPSLSTEINIERLKAF